MTDTTQLAVIAPDDAEWDAFVAAHPHGHLLQMGGWGELKGRFGWTRRRVALRGAQGLMAGAQLLIRRRFGLGMAYAPRGPLLSGAPEADVLLLAALRRVALRERAVFLRLEPNILENAPEADALHSALLTKGFAPVEPIQPRSSIHLDLAPPPERLLAGMSKGHRADIKRAAREGVVVRAGASEADLEAFYAIMSATGARAQFGIHSRDYYRAVWQIFGAQDAARLLLAEHGGATVATALVAAGAGAGLYLYSGSTAAGLECGAQHAIQWQALQWARERGCRLYDFWGVPDALGRAPSSPPDEQARLEEEARSDPLHRVYRFKKGFGGRVVRYLPAYDQVYLPPLYAAWRRWGGS
ncbi:MAG TPA: peptidoglycan bridge formation glycyltransferase FemA/FemB family protein [Roseiflexaceae bacterium]|nr:peptidoglycan bridge formation glycyltransferase FemA/FemB family protein [Roseiflexaceae bacterium]